MPDAVAVALDALYDMWERWRKTEGLSNSQADNLVSGDDDGKTAVALVHARGAKTHLFVEFGNLTDTYSDTYFDHYGAWRWQDYSDPGTQFAARNGWYGSHVSGHEVLPPLEAALRWFRSRPELG